MSTSTARRRFGFNADRRALGLVALFAVVIAGALAVRPMPVAPSASPALQSSSTATQAASGIVWAIAEAIFAGALFLLILLARRLPAWLREAVTKAIGLGVVMLGSVYLYLIGLFQFALPAVVIGAIIGSVLGEFDLWWVANNALALAAAIAVGVLIGVILPPVVIVTGLVGLMVYDHVFADRSSAMFALAGATVRWHIPMLFVIPASGMQLDWDSLADALTADEDNLDDAIGFGIGMADLALPAGFAVALAQDGFVVPLVGALAGLGLACGRISHKLEQGGGAGLPPIVAGTLGGWALLALPEVLLAWI